jgi:hypothetical protein
MTGSILTADRRFRSEADMLGCRASTYNDADDPYRTSVVVTASALNRGPCVHHNSSFIRANALATYDPQDALALGDGQLHTEANKYHSSGGINPATKAAIASEHADPTESQCNGAIPCARDRNHHRDDEKTVAPRVFRWQRHRKQTGHRYRAGEHVDFERGLSLETRAAADSRLDVAYWPKADMM